MDNLTVNQAAANTLICADSDFEDGDEFPDMEHADIAVANGEFKRFERGDIQLRVTERTH